MNEREQFSKEELRDKAIRFFRDNLSDFQLLKDWLEIELKEICFQYTKALKLPSQSLVVSIRVKTLDSTLKKLERKGWPQFDLLSDIVTDLIGARITGWFLEDCLEIVNHITATSQIDIIKESQKNYISSPKKSGYRGLHVVSKIDPRIIKRKSLSMGPELFENIKYEIQVRTVLQDFWGEVTHEFHRNVLENKVSEKKVSRLIENASQELFKVDQKLSGLRDYYQKTKNNG